MNKPKKECPCKKTEQLLKTENEELKGELEKLHSQLNDIENKYITLLASNGTLQGDYAALQIIHDGVVNESNNLVKQLNETTVCGLIYQKVIRWFL